MKIIETLEDIIFDLSDYQTYLDTWLNGLESELAFWEHFIATKGVYFGVNWFDLISDTREFNLEQYLDKEETFFIDIGSGPFSSTGKYTKRTNLIFKAVDPLAYIYKVLKRSNNIITGVTPEYCMVERLVEKYGKNKFDIVHMRNSLDHSFNPLIGIMQMLEICKIGGKIILFHATNEAERENYTGFHQWNLCIENDNFFIWRKEIKYCISKIFEKYTDIILKGTNDYCEVAIIKKIDLDLDKKLQLEIRNILDEKIFEKLSDFALKNYYPYPEIKVAKIIQNRKVYIWGAGQNGMAALHLCRYNGWEIEAFLDSNKNLTEYYGYKVIYPHNVLPRITATRGFIIISSTKYANEIIQLCEEAGLKYGTDFLGLK
jgi:SAM-dependent methyltransferase